MRFLVIAVCVVALLTSCSPGANPGATPSPPRPSTGVSPEAFATALSNYQVTLYALESPDLDPQVADWLRSQSWPFDGSEVSLDLFFTIVAAQHAVMSADHRQRAGETVAFLHALSEQPWYKDGLSAVEKRRLQLLVAPAAVGGSEFRIDLAISTLTGNLFDSLETAGRAELVLVATHDGSNENEARAALALLKAWYPSVERFAGRIYGPGIVITLDNDLATCGVAFRRNVAQSPAIISINPICLDATIVTHELIHLATPATAMTWFNEGMAYYGSELIAGPPTDVCAGHDEGPCNPTHPEIYPGYRTESAKGYQFLRDLHALIGDEALIQLIQTMQVGAGHEDILRLIRAVPPPDKLQEVEELIAVTWWRPT